MHELALSAAVFLSAVLASAHAVIYKREPRAAALWVIVIWLIPVAGPLLYVLVGVSRVRRQAIAMRADVVYHRTKSPVCSGSSSQENSLAMRGIEVEILLPERSNLPYVHWATFGQLWLGSGEFDHSKVMVVDER